MKRYYVCKIIGDGQSIATAYRPAINDIVDPATGLKAFITSAIIQTDANGQPVLPWCLVIASGQRHALAAAHPDIDPLPDYPLDVKVSAMNTLTRNRALQKMQARGIDVSDLSQADGFRDMIRSLGRKHEPTFSEDDFDVQDS